MLSKCCKVTACSPSTNIKSPSLESGVIIVLFRKMPSLLLFIKLLMPEKTIHKVLLGL